MMHQEFDNYLAFDFKEFNVMYNDDNIIMNNMNNPESQD